MRVDAQRNRQRILQVAAVVLAEDPAATLDRVIERTGLGRSTVFRHFPTRQDLVRALFQDAFESVAAALDRARLTDDGEPLPELLTRAAHALVGVSSQHHILLGGGGADLRDSELAGGYLRAMSRLAAVMTGAQRRRQLDDGVPAWWLVDAFVALLVTAGEAVDEGRLPADDLVALSLRTFLGGARHLDAR
ncbi:MAG: TetR/AcrR family transcriptional regulator [Dermatophilaceae bacterium]